MIPQTDYVKNYWRGRHPLSHVVWLDLFALSMLLSVLMDLVPQPLSIVEVTLILLVLNIIFVWQFTGAIRTIQRAFKSQSDIVMIAFLSFTLAIVSAVSLWRCIELLFTLFRNCARTDHHQNANTAIRCFRSWTHYPFNGCYSLPIARIIFKYFGQ
jgi:hypothetical protein